MLKVLGYLDKYLHYILFILLFTLGQVVANLQLPEYTAKIINEGVIGGDNNAIYRYGLLMLLLTLVGGLFTVGIGFLSSKVSAAFSRNIRLALFKKIESFSLNEFNDFSTSSLITRSTNDVEQLQRVLGMTFRLVLTAPITAVWAIYKAVNIAPDLSWIMVVAVIAVFVAMIAAFSLALPKFKLVQVLTDKLNMVTRQALTGLRVIRAFNNQEIERKNLMAVNTELTDTNLFVNKVMGLMQPLMFLIMNLTGVLIIWVYSNSFKSIEDIGNMMAFLQYSMQVIISFLMTTMVFMIMPRAVVSSKRIAEVLEKKVKIIDPSISKYEEEGSYAKVTFENVTFAYKNSEDPVLKNVSFKAKPGKITAVIGSTGSGKSTLVNLIPRFYDVTEGRVLLGNVDIREMKQKELRSHIGYVSQKPVLFTGTISDNIKYGSEEVSEEDVLFAAKTAQAEEFIEELPERYDTHVAQNGANFSGGQKQRISIARAVAKKPDIYIFDDSFSALDFKTDAKLRHELDQITKEKTVIIVAQRINTILHADQIIVLEEGKVSGIGTHSELMKTCKVYKEIALSQLSDKELKKYS